jgi:hypothetical protein
MTDRRYGWPPQNDIVGEFVILREQSDRRISGCKSVGEKILRRPDNECRQIDSMVGLLRMTLSGDLGNQAGNRVFRQPGFLGMSNGSER